MITHYIYHGKKDGRTGFRVKLTKDLGKSRFLAQEITDGKPAEPFVVVWSDLKAIDRCR